MITIIVAVDGKDIPLEISAGSTVNDAMNTANITLGEIDRVEPPKTATLKNGTTVKVIRVTEEYYTEQVILPFEYQELKNDALPKGERRLSQPGENGLEEITYHRVLEDDVEVSNNQVKSTIVKEAIPEIVMIGSREAFSPLVIPGKIAYLSAGNAWIMESSTGNRRCVVCAGDLDGRIFSLSPDERMLLFTRNSGDINSINTLWVASIKPDPAKLIELGVENIVHYAEFSPDSSEVAYSTAEWREAAPGWQANNDLFRISVSSAGFVGSPKLDLEANSGGVYGWWGTIFSWSPNEDHFIYTRPDSIGLVYPQDSTQTVVHDILPYQTGGYWAWVPGITWSPDGSVVYTVDHAMVKLATGGEYQEFDLIGLPISGGTQIDIVKNVGMFAYPVASPLHEVSDQSGNSQAEQTFSLAYLQAIFPDQSETSGYRLFTVDRDGSNPRALFPEEGVPGLRPQQVVWSPDRLEPEGEYAIAVIYNGNIWIIQTGSGTAQQLTSDGLTSRIDWR